jgi:hypothetical protein
MIADAIASCIACHPGGMLPKSVLEDHRPGNPAPSSVLRDIDPPINATIESLTEKADCIAYGYDVSTI